MKFIHTADTHLGYRQYHNPDREDDFLDAFAQVIDLAIDNSVAAVIHAGDLFHDSRPSTRTIRSALNQLHRLNQHDIHFLGVVGNHEGTYDEQWIDIFSELELATHLDKSPHLIEDVAFYGLDHIPRSKRSQVEYDFAASDASHNILVMHGLIDQISPYGEWDLTPILGESEVPFDAVLLGDDHTPRMERIDDVLVTYPGSTERTATDQTQPRVCNLIKTNNDEIGIEQLNLDTRPHVFIDLSLSQDDGIDVIKEELTSRNLDDAIVAITLRGDPGEVTPARIEDIARGHGAFIVRVSDRRDFELDDAEIDVSFADPDAAVEERLRKAGVSVPAYEIEQIVRDITGIPQSNLTDEIETRIDRRIDEAPDEFDDSADIEMPDEPKVTDAHTSSSSLSENGDAAASKGDSALHSGEGETETPSDDPGQKSNQVSFDEFNE